MADENMMSEEERLLREEVYNEVYNGDGQEIEQVTAAKAPEKTGDNSGEGVAVIPSEEQDPWAGVNPALRAAIESLTKKTGDIDNLAFRVKQTESRVGSIDNRLQGAQNAPAVKTPTKDEIEKALASSEGMAEFKADFPAHDAALEARDNALKQTLEAMRQEMKTDFDHKLTDQQQTTELKFLRYKYPNHLELIAEPGFKPWLSAQSLEVQEKYGTWDALDGIYILDHYLASKPKEKEEELPDIIAERQERLDSAAADLRKGGKATKQKNEAEMSEKELYAHYAKDIWSKK